jgi:uncharacterized membrane protein YkgB
MLNGDPRLTTRLAESSVYATQGNPPETQNREMEMEKQLSMISYWLGVISTVLALIFRAFTAINMIPPHMAAPGGSALSYMSFLHGAVLFFLLTIASWCRTAKS